MYTGHRTTEVVLKHCFRPGREDFRAALMSAMPKMLSERGEKPAREEMREILEGMNAGNWREDRKRLLKLLEKL